MVLKWMKRDLRERDISEGSRVFKDSKELPLNYFAFFSVKVWIVL